MHDYYDEGVRRLAAMTLALAGLATSAAHAAGTDPDAWQFAPSFVAKAGYRYFYQDYEDNGFVWDMVSHGFYLGLGIRF